MSIFRILPPLLLVLNVSCGQYTTKNIRDYNIFVESDDEEIQDTIRVLTEEFNEQFGGEAITIVDTVEESNSSIGFIRGLKARENKLGLGQWITVTSEEGQDLLPSSNRQKLEKTVIFSMEIDFDLENFRDKMGSRESKEGGDWNHLYHLFCHEVGHGLQMGHEGNIRSVMYKSIPDQSRIGVDYDRFFEKARDFFRD